MKYCKHCGEEKIPKKELNIASSSKRFINLLIDYVGLIIFAIGIGMIFGVLGIIDGSEGDEINNVLGFLAYFSYYIIFEGFWQKTLGKVITKTKVVSVDGNNAAFTQILLRTFFRFVPFEAFSLLGHKPVGWHDRWSKTLVIEE